MRGETLTQALLNTFTIITTDPNSLLRPIHNRMPVIYDRPLGRQWLEYQFGGSAMALAAAPALGIHGGVGCFDPGYSPENDTAACVEPVATSPPIKRQLSAPVVNDSASETLMQPQEIVLKEKSV
jgi:hypothetical protein